MNYMAAEYWVDGGCHNNGSPGATSYGSYSDGKDIVRINWGTAYKTNNEAEYATLESLLTAIHTPGDTQDGPIIYTDSRLLEGQMMENWHIKAPNLQRLAKDCMRLMVNKKAIIKWVSRVEIVERLGH